MSEEEQKEKAGEDDEGKKFAGKAVILPFPYLFFDFPSEIFVESMFLSLPSRDFNVRSPFLPFLYRLSRRRRDEDRVRSGDSSSSSRKYRVEDEGDHRRRRNRRSRNRSGGGDNMQKRDSGNSLGGRTSR